MPGNRPSIPRELPLAGQVRGASSGMLASSIETRGLIATAIGRRRRWAGENNLGGWGASTNRTNNAREGHRRARPARTRLSGPEMRHRRARPSAIKATSTRMGARRHGSGGRQVAHAMGRAESQKARGARFDGRRHHPSRDPFAFIQRLAVAKFPPKLSSAHRLAERMGHSFCRLRRGQPTRA